MKSHTLHVSGMHCASCKIFIEDAANEQDFVRNAHVDLKHETLEFETESDEKSEALAAILTEKVRSHGYVFSLERNDLQKPNEHVIWTALPMGFGVLALFFWLQKSGLLNVGFGGSVTPLTSFLIGLVASVSSCLAIVGGLVLSLSAKISQDDVSDTQTFVLFHVARLVSFGVLGGVLGAIGGFVGINLIFTSILGLLASLVMLFLGLNLVGIFEKSQFTMHSSLFDFLRRVEHRTFAPLVLGFATFFLPCGFTQAMQVSALSSGSFLSGFLIMFSFSLGTLPMLALLSFGSASFAHGKHAPLFFKSAGVVVIGLALFAMASGLAGLGIIPPLFNV